MIAAVPSRLALAIMLQASMTVLMVGRVPIRCQLESQPLSDRANES
jgi:hypothetical protein